MINAPSTRVCGVSQRQPGERSMDVFYEIHSDLPREGPGRDEDTARALRLALPHLPEAPRILDIGCGPGMQTAVLAQQTRGSIVALDRHPPFLEQLTARAAQAGIQDRIQTVEGTMTDMPFEPATFDLIWAEGAIYVMGYEAGLHAWRPLLKPGGCMAVTELTWLVDDPRPEPHTFWREAYPNMRGLKDNQRMIAEAGYRELGHFQLPPRGLVDPLLRTHRGPHRAAGGPLRRRPGRAPDPRRGARGDRPLPRTQRSVQLRLLRHAADRALTQPLRAFRTSKIVICWGWSR